MRDRLIELLDSIQDKGKKYEYTENSISVLQIDNGTIADYLIANGVIVPPCKVGDEVYEVDYDFESDKFEVVESKVWGIAIMTTNNIHTIENLGKTVFLTKEEAEKAFLERK